MECPACKGKRESFAFLNMGDKGHRGGMVTCRTCKGTGVITNEHWRRILAGKAARKDRIERGETIRQAANRKCVTALEISKFERGEA